MLPALLLSLREGLEAALLIGIVFGTLEKLNLPGLKRYVWLGAGAAAAASLLAALGLNWLGLEFAGRGEEIFEGTAMFLAAGVLTWMILWMQNSTAGKELERKTRAAALGGSAGLMALAFLAVFREGLELALFLFAARLTAQPLQTLTGAAAGLAGAALLGWAVFRSSHHLSLRGFFRATNLLLVLFAAGLVGMAVGEWNEAGLIPVLTAPVWDLSSLLSDQFGLGAVLRALFGYTANPSLSAVLAYAAYWAAALALLFFRRPRGPLNHPVPLNPPGDPA